MERIDILNELEDILISSEKPTKVKIDSSWYNVGFVYEDEYELYAFAKIDYQHVDNSDIKIALCGYITTGYDDQNAPVNTYVKSRLEGFFEKVTFANKGFDFYGEEKSLAFDGDDANAVEWNMARYVGAILGKPTDTLENIVNHMHEQAAKTVRLSKKTKALMGIKSNLQTKEATVVEMRGVGESFFEICGRYSGVQNHIVILVGNLSYSPICDAAGEADGSGKLDKDGQQAYDFLVSCDADYVLVWK